MALYTPDYEYIRVKEIVEKMEGPQGDLVRYYISVNEKYEQSLRDKIKEMEGVFKGIKKFMN